MPSPNDDPTDRAPKAVLSAAFWSMMVLAAACLAAAALIATEGPRLFVRRPPPPPLAAPARTAMSAHQPARPDRDPGPP